MLVALLARVRWRRATQWARRHAYVIVLLSLHTGLLVQGARQSSVTVDEAAHFAAGMYNWQTGDFSLYRVNPPLVRMLGALPAVIAGAELPPRPPRVHVASRPEGLYAEGFAEVNRDNYHQLVFLARLPGILWSLLGALLVYVWARELFGRRCALIGLGLWCLEPNLIAHAQLLTPDLPATVAGLAATYTFWRYLRAPSRKRAVLASVALGIAQLTKFTLLILYPIIIVLWLAFHAGRLRSSVALVAMILAISVVILNAGYGFQGTATRLGDITFVSESFTGEHRPDRAVAPRIVRLGNRLNGTWLGSLPLPVPLNYVRGIDLQRHDFETGLRSYLRGTWQDRGWWYYYLYALWVKLPLGVIALVVWGAADWARRARTEWRDQIAVAVPALAIIGFVSIQTGFTHHLRYVLPAFPFLILLASRVGAAARGRLGTAALVGLLGWTAVSSLRVQPHSLAYFNELAGGPAAGAEHLIDSNLDWGQDLLRLRNWLVDHPRSERLRLAYFGTIDPELVGIEYKLPPPGLAALEPGRYAISVNFIYGLRYRAFNGAKQIVVVEPNDYTHFQQLRPVERIGGSILVFDVTEADIASLRGNPV